MKALRHILLGALLAISATVLAITYGGGGAGPMVGIWPGFTLGTLLAFEDDVNNVAKVEIQASGKDGITADGQVGAAGVRYLYSVTCAGTDAAATAGDMTVRDAAAAGAGDVVQTIGFAAAYFAPVTLWFNAPFATGIYFDFTTTADVMCSASYR